MPGFKQHCEEHSKVMSVVADLKRSCEGCRETTDELRERTVRQDEAMKGILTATNELTAMVRDLVKKVDIMERKLDQFEGGLGMMKFLIYLAVSAGGVSFLIIVGKALEHIR